ncbi:MAG: flagellar motor switch protein FliN [Bryobacterales bacterium]|nr:flagellar motor switch protein FliN [Acidobacteriota bacterium]MCB9384910.1 flagellar motor switch protein FliN [Bryobacterales bacterium]
MRIETNGADSVTSGHWFAQAWAAALGDVAEALDLGGGAGPLEVRAAKADPETWKSWPDPIWQGHTWLPNPKARLWLGCDGAVPEALWAHIGGPEDDTGEQVLETFREMINQAAAGAAAEATSRLGTPMQPTPFADADAPEAGWAIELRFQAQGQEYALALVGDSALSQTLNPSEVGTPDAPEPATPASKAAVQPTAGDPFEMIREVHLELSVSFGDTVMPLADVLKLSSGAIIELNRSVSDPVEVLVNDSVIARGDVVVVDGNYGVRITEIVSRRARVRSML